METKTPLLNGAPSPATTSTTLKLLENGDYLSVKSFEEVKWVFWIETVKMWKIAGPIAFQIICQYGTNSFTSIFVGHIGNIELSAVTISLTVIGTFSFGFMLGMGSALETLCGQAFGAGQIHLLGVYMQRSWIILLASCFIILPIYIFATPILKILGQEENIAELAGQFTILTIPQLFSLAVNCPTGKFLQAQSKVNVLAWIGFVALLLHIGILWLFIDVLGWGTTGAAIAFDITNWVITLAQVAYAIFWCDEVWTGFSWLAFKDIWAFVRLSIASAIMLCLEVWYMMSMILLVGHLDNAVIAVGSLSICMNLNGWEAMLFIGINAAMSVRVSNELGWGHPRAAKYSVYVTVVQSLFIGLLCMVLLVITKDDFAVIFTSSKTMQRAVSHLAYLLGITMVLNSVQPVISGVAVGGGWQSLVAYINLGCYYAFGLPLGCLLGYIADFGVMGLWGGMIAGTALQTLLLLNVLWKTNWTKEVEQTSERMKKWGGQDITTVGTNTSV
ncbi:Detoxifying efflux carrier 35 isoform 3 [Hibiscus syriacus]|uniref:Protein DETOXIFICATION n=1 Tax=Hibiscus syriacus TaxID=106335 RepID=A0A6A2YQ22_HIBSY|nr:protein DETOXIFICATION 35-like [Hibiscus syriacus]KAE8681464.1 Detoxifying efflux carrier 35 isoform 3 [Hibiscus syriacus]